MEATQNACGGWRCMFRCLWRFEPWRFDPCFSCRYLQDVLVVTAPGSGAEVIPFLKTWVNLPMAIGFTVLYAKVSCLCTHPTSQDTENKGGGFWNLLCAKMRFGRRLLHVWARPPKSRMYRVLWLRSDGMWLLLEASLSK